MSRTQVIGVKAPVRVRRQLPQNSVAVAARPVQGQGEAAACLGIKPAALGGKDDGVCRGVVEHVVNGG
ncbi:hypothetical protein SDC9_122487 [bioreactor metagenome]|uniref:Uncharacterized protein n=1 Tax=bioreactor metagenome TaxID=1076179 RepID=A0A645CEZ9_9ZZZZ